MITIQDPRVSAYILGELSAEQSQEIEQAIAHNADFAAQVESLRRTIESLFDALPKAPLPSPITKRQPQSQYAHWIKFFIQSAVVLLIGGVFYFLSMSMAGKSTTAVKSVPLTTSAESAESSITEEVPDDLLVIEIPHTISEDALEISHSKTWDSYGFTPEQASQFNESSPVAKPQLKISYVSSALSSWKNRLADYYASQDRNTNLSKRIPSGIKGKNLGGTVSDDQMSDRLTVENPIEYVSMQPKSSFGLLPGDGSYSIMNRYLTQAFSLPPEQSVRVEQYINHFRYNLPQVEQGANCPFTVTFEMGVHPWAQGLVLAKVAVQAKSGGSSEIIAKNAFVDVEFNPDLVQAYRLIGYEKRLTPDNSSPYRPVVADKVPADSQVVALYELILTNATVLASKTEAKLPAKTQIAQNKSSQDQTVKTSVGYVPPEYVIRQPAWFTLKLNYTDPATDTPCEKSFEALSLDSAQLQQTTLNSADFRFAAAVALYGQLLQKSAYCGTANLETVKELLRGSVEHDTIRREFAELVSRAGQVK